MSSTKAIYWSLSRYLWTWMPTTLFFWLNSLWVFLKLITYSPDDEIMLSIMPPPPILSPQSTSNLLKWRKILHKGNQLILSWNQLFLSKVSGGALSLQCLGEYIFSVLKGKYNHHYRSIYTCTWTYTRRILFLQENNIPRAFIWPVL